MRTKADVDLAVAPRSTILHDDRPGPGRPAGYPTAPPEPGPLRTERLIREAERLCAAGLRVVRVGWLSKTPIGRDWPSRASSDPGVIVPAIRRRGPRINLGIATGQGVVGLDVDPRHDGRASLDRLLGPDFWSGAATATAHTGGGGRHFLFRVDRRWVVRNGPLDRARWPGLDIKGDGGFLVVEPSIHPDPPWCEYAWTRLPGQGIAPLPRALRRALVEWGMIVPRSRRGVAPVPARVERPPAALSVPIRPAAVEDLVATLLPGLIARYPIERRGTRNDQQLRLVVELLGRGYAPGVVEAVAWAWVTHHLASGVIGSSLTDCRRELTATVACKARQVGQTIVLRACPTADGRPETSEAEHTRRSAALAFSAAETSRLDRIATPGRRRRALPSEPIRLSPERLIRRVVTLAEDETAGVIATDRERRFVEGLMACVKYERDRRGDGVVRFTWGQLRAILTARSGEPWDGPTLDRLFRLYVDRPGRPAAVCSLLAQVLCGRRGALVLADGTRREGPGIASEYRVTGLAALLDAPADDVADAAPGA